MTTEISLIGAVVAAADHYAREPTPTTPRRVQVGVALAQEVLNDHLAQVTVGRAPSAEVASLFDRVTAFLEGAA